ncbi:unnamed protein product [Paramecium primaurelia]|uniref:Protein kinase domain-containing protein n=1 Tax=Paramecium primaurelia TaxID=5886 RepID=A0A8S1LKI5_PARPR|nr:unnamed protein product [Paramecium primaurelia]
MKSIKHKNIVEFKDIQQNRDSINMIIEYGDLQMFIKTNYPSKTLPESKTKQIVLQLLDAMKYLRLKNIVHRDLKLANILINEQMQIKLADFGYSKSLINNELLQIYCGTPTTMAPEILKNSKSYNHKCDIWSLGVILYRILYGYPPFVSSKGTAQDLLLTIQNNNHQFTQHIFLSAECKDLQKKMLVVDSKNRINFEDLFKHQWCYQDNIDQEKSLFKVNLPQHQDFLKNLNYSIILYQQQLTQIVQSISFIENKYQDLKQFCQRFKNSLDKAFSTFYLKIYYQNQIFLIKVPQILIINKNYLFFLQISMKKHYKIISTFKNLLA